jgi:SAM-dependent methyltransferase
MNAPTRREPDLTSKLHRLVGRGLQSSPPSARAALYRGRNRIVRLLEPAHDIAPATDASAVWVSPPVPVPDGCSLTDIEETFRSWSVNGEPVGHLAGYVDDSLWRFLHTWGMVRNDAGRCLELGANPYFTTYLLDRHTDLDLTLSNFYGQRGETDETVSFVPGGETARTELIRRSQLFNVEEDEFPFGAASFDVVLFCEMLEHLLMDPVGALRQIHRVLKPDGVLILTTPNVARLANVLAMVHGTNIYDPYSGYGPYGRHNREYTRHELHRLLDFAGFEVEYSLTADGHAWSVTDWPRHAEAVPLVRYRGGDLGQYLLVRARATRPPSDGLPSFLYRSWPEGRIVPFD